MMKRMLIALLAMVMVMGTVAYAEEEGHKCACGDACDHKGCACATAPAAVKEAAAKSMEGLKLGCIHVAKTDAGQVFTFAATKGDKAFTVTVTVDKDGKVTDTKCAAKEEKKDGAK
jgi:hypothetical protein